MKVLITGICGFAGTVIAERLLDASPPGSISIVGLDNLSRAGSWINPDA